LKIDMRRGNWGLHKHVVKKNENKSGTVGAKKGIGLGKDAGKSRCGSRRSKCGAQQKMNKRGGSERSGSPTYGKCEKERRFVTGEAAQLRKKKGETLKRGNRVCFGSGVRKTQKFCGAPH